MCICTYRHICIFIYLDIQIFEYFNIENFAYGFFCCGRARVWGGEDGSLANPYPSSGATLGPVSVSMFGFYLSIVRYQKNHSKLSAGTPIKSADISSRALPLLILES